MFETSSFTFSKKVGEEANKIKTILSQINQNKNTIETKKGTANKLLTMSEILECFRVAAKITFSFILYKTKNTKKKEDNHCRNEKAYVCL